MGGSDMARFYLDLTHKVHKFYTVAVDLKRKRVDVSLVCIVDYWQEPIQKVLKECPEPTTVQECFELIHGLLAAEIQIEQHALDKQEEADEQFARTVLDGQGIDDEKKV